MNNHNFIVPIAPKKQREIRRWYIISCYSAIIVICLISALTIQQVYDLWHLKKDYQLLSRQEQEYETFLKTVEQLEIQETALAKKLKKLTQFCKNPIMPSTLFEHLTTMLPNDVAFSKVILNDHRTVELQGHAMNTQGITTLLQRLDSSPLLTQIHVTSLHHQSQQATANAPCLQFVMQGTIKK